MDSYSYYYVKQYKNTLGKASHMYGTDLMIELLEAWGRKFDRAVFKQIADSPRKEDLKPQQTPPIPPKPGMSDAEKKEELDRILKEHGVDPSKANDTQKAFYGQFIGKSPEEIAKSVTGLIKGSKNMDPTVVKDMATMRGLAGGKESPLWNDLQQGLKDRGLPYDMMATEHLVALADQMCVGMDQKDAKGKKMYKDQFLKGTKLPPKTDFTKLDPESLATYTAIFAMDRLMSKISPAEMAKGPVDMEAIGKAMESIHEAGKEKVTELGLDANMQGSTPRKETMATFEHVAENQAKKKQIASRIARERAHDLESANIEIDDEKTTDERRHQLRSEKYGKGSVKDYTHKAAVTNRDNKIKDHEEGLEVIDSFVKETNDKKAKIAEGRDDRTKLAHKESFNYGLEQEMNKVDLDSMSDKERAEWEAYMGEMQEILDQEKDEISSQKEDLFKAPQDIGFKGARYAQQEQLKQIDKESKAKEARRQKFYEEHPEYAPKQNNQPQDETPKKEEHEYEEVMGG